MTHENDKQRREPAGDDGAERELARVLRPALEPAPDLADLFGSVSAQLAQERGFGAWLRSRATALRALIAFGVIALPAALTLLTWLRPDIGEYPAGRMALALAAIALLIAAGVTLVLRPLHRPVLPASIGNATIAGALFCLLALYSWPIAHESQAASLQVPGAAALLSAARPCVLTGLLLGAAVFFALRALDRGGARRALLRAAASGLCANLVLQLHCPNSAPIHLVLGHFAVLAVLLALVALWPRSLRD